MTAIARAVPTLEPWDGCELSTVVFEKTVHHRLRNHLRQHDVRTLDDLRRVGLSGLQEWRYFGPRCLHALRTATGLFTEAPPPPPPRQRYDYRKLRNQAIFAALQDGHSDPEIAARFGLSPVALRRLRSQRRNRQRASPVQLKRNFAMA